VISELSPPRCTWKRLPQLGHVGNALEPAASGHPDVHACPTFFGGTLDINILVFGLGKRLLAWRRRFCLPRSDQPAERILIDHSHLVGAAEEFGVDAGTVRKREDHDAALILRRSNGLNEIPIAGNEHSVSVCAREAHEVERQQRVDALLDVERPDVDGRGDTFTLQPTAQATELEWHD
jgi:hypothetical protein